MPPDDFQQIVEQLKHGKRLFRCPVFGHDERQAMASARWQ